MEFLTYGHRPIDPENIDPQAIHIEAIAVALSRKVRWGGHSPRAMTVAQHSVLVARIVAQRGGSPTLQLAGLLHDACEAYVEDLPRPIKRLCPDYVALHDRFAAAIAARFDLGALLTPRLDARIAYADDVILQTERRDLWGLPRSRDVAANASESRIVPWPSPQARAAFESTFYRLDALRRPTAA